MTAYLVLGSIGLLLVLLIHGKISPAILFSTWAGAYYLFGLVPEKVYLSAFTNSALATLILLMLVSLALERTPILDKLSTMLFRGGKAVSAVFRLSLVAAVFSAFLNNTAVVGAFLGVVTKQRLIAPSKVLIPLSYASLFGGIITLVGTSTNLVVNSFTVSAGLPALGMFQFAWVGLPTALICILVLSLTSRLLPDNRTADDISSSQRYFLEAQVQQDSPLAGRTIEQNRLRRLDGLYLVEILREGRLISPVNPEEVLLAGDVLIFSGETEKVQALKQFDGLAVFGTDVPELLHSNLVEAVISNESELANRTLRDVDFRTMFDAGVVGIRRGDRQLRGQLGQITLHVGDALLLAVGPDFKQHRNIDRNFHVLDDTLQRPVLNTLQSTLAMSGFAVVILLSALEIAPLFSGLLVLLAALLITKILTLSELRRRFPFELMIIIASALSVAHALDASGAADLIASVMRSAFDAYGVMGAFVGVYLITMLLTELITNNAAAALAFPIALSTAKAFGVDPTPFIMAIAYGASACFLFPFGYQTHLMVYSPGRYRVKDFFRVGLPIAIVYSLCILILVPIVFPF
ncbi:SLC13 family permease [Advenella sp. FME57]|uniref:SLC13 family permease n=1 Tax=Advenella sp. FME57 TaxID=2742604 RepID=UPI0018666CC4|nr:SLC13 family permease [Advenella sp. FME57]